MLIVQDIEDGRNVISMRSEENCDNGLSVTWGINVDNISQNVFKKFSKAHKEEYESVFANLDKVKGFLSAGEKVGEFKLHFFRSEGGGLYRISQSNLPKNSYETRLYLYPDEERKVIYILGIGGKSSQKKDISNCKRIIGRINTEDRDYEKRKNL